MSADSSPTLFEDHEQVSMLVTGGERDVVPALGVSLPATMFPLAFLPQRCIEPGCGVEVSQAQAFPSWRFKLEGWLCEKHRDQ